MKRKIIALLCAIVMLLPLTACMQKDTQESAYDKLLKNMAEEAASRANFESQTLNMYHGAVSSADFSKMPAYFDLRELGYVPPVRSQGNWGTCWAFSILGASEISMLFEMGLTAEEFEQLTGHPMDLSEKHLSWFANGTLPALENYPQGEYIYPGYESQAGEGIAHINEEKVGDKARYENGGWAAYGSTIFNSGIGPVWEKDFPYTASNGKLDFTGDWSLPEELRFLQNVKLENSFVLPSPAMRDEQGKYVYNEAGTYAIKSELMAGRAVSISYHSDQALDPEVPIKQFHAVLEMLGIIVTLEDARLYDQFEKDELVLEALTREQLTMLYRIMRMINHGITLENVMAELETLSDEEVIRLLNDYRESMRELEGPEKERLEKLAREAAEKFGLDYEKLNAHFEAVKKADNTSYISKENHAQYTDNELASPDHLVVIVGWDDNYPAENFLEGKQPPADGAWIVRNSWGENYGFDGYFYLSYYDKSITAPETFDFEIDPSPELPEELISFGWDFMPVDFYSSVHMDSMVQQANVFSFNTEDAVLDFVSVYTADLDVQVTVDVYLLNDGAQNPDDGVLLDRVTKNFAYGGYHRVELSQDFLLPLGSRIGVVVTQSMNSSNGTVYSLPYPTTRNENFAKTITAFIPDSFNYYSPVGIIGKGESFVKVDGRWTDWADVVKAHREGCKSTEFLSYDNFGIKVHTYRLEDVQEMHKFDHSVDSNGATEHKCKDCSYSFVEKK